MGRIRTRVTLTLDPDLYRRAKFLAGRMRNYSVSRVVDDLLADALPWAESRTDLELHEGWVSQLDREYAEEQQLALWKETED